MQQPHIKGTNMDNMDQFSNEDAIDYQELKDVEEETKLGLKRVGVMSLFIDHANSVAQLDTAEIFYYNLAEDWWKVLSTKQKNVVFLYIVQRKSQAEIAIVLNTDRSNIYRILERAFSKSQRLFSKRK